MSEEAASLDDEDSPCPFIRIPHPLECRRTRPRREQRWLPKQRGLTPEPRRSAVERWHEPKLEAAPDTGQIRIRFSYDAWFSTLAGFSIKSGRAVYHEGPVEPAGWIAAETLPKFTDLQFQPLRIVWRRGFGKTRHLTLDAGFEHEDGTIAFTEYKGHEAYFGEPDMADLLDEAEEVLRRHGASLHREHGGDLLEPVRFRSLRDVFDDRSTPFDTIVDVIKVKEAILAGGGAAPLGLVLEALGGPARLASARLNAMSVRRIVRIDLSRPQMLDTLVDQPPQVQPGRLRAFLRKHALTEAA
jgi:hypothetical protein